MDAARKNLALLCAALFIISAIAALFVFNIEWRAFDSASYKQAFENQNLYERIPEILAQALFTSIAEDSNLDTYLKILTVDEWQAVIAAFLPPEEIKALTDNALDATFDYLNGKTDSASVSLMPLKQHFSGAGGMQAMNLILQAQPECTLEQLIQIGFEFPTGKLSLCKVPPELMGMVTPLLETQLQVMTFAFPDEFNLIPARLDNDPRIILNRSRTFLKITPIFALFFLFCLSIFAIRDVLDWLKWWGWSFFIAGILSTLIAWIGAPTFGLIAGRIFQDQGAGFVPPILFSTLRETVTAVTSQILKPVVLEGMIIGIVGLGMVIIGEYLARKEYA